MIDVSLNTRESAALEAALSFLDVVEGEILDTDGYSLRGTRLRIVDMDLLDEVPDEIVAGFDFSLRAESREAMMTALSDLLDFGANGVPFYTERYAFDPIGSLVITEAEVDEDGEIIAPAEIDGRFHANFRVIDRTLAARVPADLTVFPENPKRVWA